MGLGVTAPDPKRKALVKIARPSTCDGDGSPRGGRRPGTRLGFVLGGLLTLSWLAFAAFGRDGTGRLDAGYMSSVGRLLSSLAALAALFLGSMCVMRWRSYGEPSDLHVGVAVLVLGVVRSGLGEAQGSATLASGWLTTAAALCFVAAFGVCLGPSVGRVRREPSGTLGIVRALAPCAVLLVGLLLLVPGVGGVFAGTRVAPAVSTGQWVGHLAIAGGWLAMAALYARRARSGRSSVGGWYAFVFLVMAQSRFALALSFWSGSTWLIASYVLRLDAFLFGLAGLLSDQHDRVQRYRGELHEARTAVQRAEADRRSDRATKEEAAHDLRAALYALGGTAETLAEHAGEIDRETLETLMHAIASEMTRLQDHVEGQQPPAIQALCVAELLQPMVVCARARGIEMELDVDEGLVALGRPEHTVEVVRNLLDNATRHAPGSPVTIRAERQGSCIVVSVQDRGPGVDARDRESVFVRGWRGGTAGGIDGHGLGLAVAARLMAQQAGTIRVEPRPGGGASFVLSLPAAPRSGIDAPEVGLSVEPIAHPLDQQHDVEQVGRRLGPATIA
jgi:signal transduction histidine kinase